MTTLAVDEPNLPRVGDSTFAFKIKASTVVYAGGLVAIDSTGYLKPYSGAVGEQPLGIMDPTPDPYNPGTSPITGSSTTLIKAAVQLEGCVLKSVPVAGTSSIADIGKLVYISTDNVKTDLTLTRPTRGIPVGRVMAWISSTTCDVKMYSQEALDCISLAGNGSVTVQVLSGLDSHFDDGAADYTVPAPDHRFKITGISVGVTKALAGGTSLVFTPKVGGVASTGSATVNTSGGTGGTAGDLVTAAVSANNTGSASTALAISCAPTGTFTSAGVVNVYLKIERLLGV